MRLVEVYVAHEMHGDRPRPVDAFKRRAASGGAPTWSAWRWLALVALLAALAVGVGVWAGGDGALVAPVSKGRVARAYGRLPLAFAPNRGQAAGGARFVAHTRGSTVSLTRRGAALSLAHGGGGGTDPVLSLRFAGADSWPSVRGVGRLPGKVNYLASRNRADWHTGIPTYARVAYRHVWPGVDAAFYGHRGRLEYDFDVAAGANPDRIALRVGGARSIRVTPGGTLALGVSGGTVRQLRPRAYQMVDGRRRAVAARYVLSGGEVRIHLGAYDHRRRLVIDPALAYSTHIASNAQAIALDSHGAAYITGTARAGTPTKNAMQPTVSGGGVFVSKLSPDGRTLEYSTYLGGDSGKFASGIAVDGQGAVYVTGSAGAGLPTRNAAQPAFGGGRDDAFVAKLSPDGQSLEYATYLGGSDGEIANAIAVNTQGDAYVTGTTLSPNFPTRNAEQGTLNGTTDAFVSELSPDGKTLAHSTYLGGSGDETGSGIALDAQGAAYVTGTTLSPDFPTKDAEQPAYAGGSYGDAFVAKLSPDGSSLDYSTYLGGPGSETGGPGMAGDDTPAIAVDAQGAAYVAGETSSSGLATPGAVQTQGGGGNGDHAYFDAFVTKLNPDGRSLGYFTYLGGNGGQDGGFGSDIAVTPQGAAYVTGGTASTDFPTTKNAIQPKSGGGEDAFVSVLAPDGRSLLFSTYLGGLQDDEASGIAADPAGDAYVTGSGGAGFPTEGTGQPAFSAPSGFAVKLSASGHTPTIPGAPLCHGHPATIVSRKDHATVRGTAEADVIVATGRGDRIRGGPGNDIICAGPGEQRIHGGRGHDVIYAGSGDDVVHGGEGRDLIHGNRGADRLYGDRGPDVIHGGKGPDRIYGNRGADRLYGDRGADILHGGKGPDRLHGGPGADRLYGDRGRDRLQGGRGSDICHGGPGHDTLHSC